MAEENATRCNVGDILCQMQVLTNLKGLKSALGDESFKSRVPELEGLDQTIMERIEETDATLSEALRQCGFPSMEDIVEPTAEPEVEPVIEEG